MNIDLSVETVEKSLATLKPDKASSPDSIAPKLLKHAGKAVIQSLYCRFILSVVSSVTNTVPTTWKKANISALYKDDDETDKQNYRPISLLSVPGKIMENVVAGTIITHVSDQGLSSL